jgi:hypothetical protein
MDYPLCLAFLLTSFVQCRPQQVPDYASPAAKD